MVKITVEPVSEPCLCCVEPYNVSFRVKQKHLTVRNIRYHHEKDEIVAFSEGLARLEAARIGQARLVSKGEDSILILKFVRPGGELMVSGRLELDFCTDEDSFDEKVSYFELVDSEYVGAFLKDLVGEMTKVQGPCR